MHHTKNLAFLALALLFAPPSFAKKPTLLEEFANAVRSQTDKAPATGQIEIAFSPDGGSEALVLKTINAAQRSVRLAAYSFTSPAIVKALIAAHRRGVDVRVVVDEKGNKSKSGTAALNLLVNAGIQARTNRKYAIHHDKYIIVDDLHVQTGSFNYSKAAAKSNSENVLVVWHNADLAASYRRHWQSRFEQGSGYQSAY
jgi:phosphatidylserine/phosphatidylglycerophosphate/cardiolipin synthase-like enzyme